jgi:RNA polymerase sigma-70 factor, ECF subfamily
MGQESEAQLLARCRKGEADAWDQLFELHYPAVGRFVFQLGYSFTQEDTEEICQEVFLSVVRSLESFQGNSQFQTWLFRIAVNKARDYRQRQHAAKRGGGALPISLDAEDPETGLRLDLPSPAPSPDAVLAKTEKLHLVHKALEQMDDPCREIIELRYFGDLSYEEIGQALKLNIKTVSSRLSKCLDQLEAVLNKLFSKENEVQIPSNKPMQTFHSASEIEH